jgi:hypothetical protein
MLRERRHRNTGGVPWPQWVDAVEKWLVIICEL